MGKNDEVELSEVELQLLHVAGQHLAAAAVPEMGKAGAEARELYKLTGDERFNQLYNVIEQTIGALSKTIRSVMETIPGVVIPSVDEIKQMIAEAQAEQEFMEIIAKNQEVLH